MPEIISNPPPRESVWKRITRLFRSGPVIRHKIAAGERMTEPRGTATAYKKEISSLYVHSLASYGQYERLSRYADYCEMEFCISPNTLIAIPGGFKTIKDLADEHGIDGEFVVYSWDHSKGKIVPARAKQARKTRTDMAYRVSFDNGKEIIGTIDHRLMLRDGSYKKIGELECGDAMMPFKREFLWNSPYQSIYDGNKWIHEHRMLGEFIADRPLSSDEVVHHLNERKFDNDIENLEVMTRKDHSSHHLAEYNRLKWHPANQKWIEKFRSDHSRFMTDRNPSARLDVTFSAILQVAETNGFHLFKTMEILDIDYPTIVRRLKECSFKNWESFAKAYDSKWKNHGQDNRGDKNPRWDKSLTFQMICEAWESGIRPELLAKKLETTNAKICNRVKKNGFLSSAAFCRDYNNCRVTSVERVGVMDLYDLTVDGYKNFATNSVISHNTPEISSALDIYSDESTAYDENNNVLKIVSKNNEIKQVLETLFFDILNIEFNIWSWTRNLVKYGDFILFVDASEENGILNMLPIPINEIEREEGYSKEDPFAVRFRWLTQGNSVLENWQVVHFRLLGNDSFLPYGCSVIEAARRIWRQLILIEDAMLVYRIVRSPERRVFKIDVGNIPPNEIDSFMETIKTRLRRNQIVDPTTGRVDLRYNPLPVRQDTIVPLLDGRQLTIAELAREYEIGRENWVYSIQDGTRSVVPGKIKWCGRNYTCDQIHRVWLDDGTYVDSAPEHPFVMRDGSRRRADELVPGDSLMAVYRDLNNRGYERLIEPCGGRVSTHVMVARDAHRKKWDSQENRVVHHKTDLGHPDKRNNNPDRLDVMDFWEHRRYHAKHCELTLNTPERLEERRARRIIYNRSPEKRRKTSEQNVIYQKAQKMGASYNGTELHRSHNASRRAAQLASWGENLESRSEAMRWIIPNEVMQIVFDRVKEEPNIPRKKLWDFVKGNGKIRELIAGANARVNQRNPDKFHCTAIQSKLEKMGELPAKTGFPEFRSYLARNPVPMNHQVTHVEVLNEIDDVYCMTVVGSNGEDDRHNFALLGSGVGANNDDKYLKSLIFVWNSVDEDYFLPVRGDKSSDITTLAGGQFTGDIDDVQYIQSKLFAALKIPKAYLGYEGELGSKATLSQQDVRFSRSIERIQKILIAELSKIAIIHLFLLGYEGEDLVDFEIQMASSSTIAEQQKLELWRMRFEIAGTAQEGTLDRETIYRRIFHMSDDEIERVREGKRVDRLEDITLEAMTAQEAEPGAVGASGEAGQAVPGEDELPLTLGGDEGATEGGGEPEVAPEGISRGDDLAVLTGERRNPGSEGNHAEYSANFGKDLFSTGEDQHALVFGTEKQTASDPGDLRALRRLVTRPFSESRDVADTWLVENIERSRVIGEGIESLLKERKIDTRKGITRRRSSKSA